MQVQAAHAQAQALKHGTSTTADTFINGIGKQIGKQVCCDEAAIRTANSNRVL